MRTVGIAYTASNIKSETVSLIHNKSRHGHIMTKTNALLIVLYLIFLVVFNAIYFLIGGTSHLASEWISYGFIHFAYLMLIMSPPLIRKGKNAALFGISLYSIASVYFFITFISGVTLIIFYPNVYKTSLLIHLCLSGLYGIILICNMIANEYRQKAKPVANFVKISSAKVKALLEFVDDPEIKNYITELYDTLRSAPVKSHPNMSLIESQILISIDELGNVIAAGNKEYMTALTKSLLIAANERTRQLKILK